MKYLQRFNENTDNFQEELKDFCETNLAYLLDEGIEVQVTDNHNYSVDGDPTNYLIRIIIKEYKSWNEIKDQMIPFLTRLRNRYEIGLRKPTKGIQFDLGLSNMALDTIMKDDIRFLYFTSRVHSKQVINDKVENMIKDKPDLWTDRRSEIKLNEIRLYIGGYKQPKKSILTKIKSFFK